MIIYDDLLDDPLEPGHPQAVTPKPHTTRRPHHPTTLRTTPRSSLQSRIIGQAMSGGASASSIIAIGGVVFGMIMLCILVKCLCKRFCGGGDGGAKRKNDSDQVRVSKSKSLRKHHRNAHTITTTAKDEESTEEQSRSNVKGGGGATTTTPTNTPTANTSRLRPQLVSRQGKPRGGGGSPSESKELKDDESISTTRTNRKGKPQPIAAPIAAVTPPSEMAHGTSMRKPIVGQTNSSLPLAPSQGGGAVGAGSTLSTLPRGPTQNLGLLSQNREVSRSVRMGGVIDSPGHHTTTASRAKPPGSMFREPSRTSMNTTKMMSGHTSRAGQLPPPPNNRSPMFPSATSPPTATNNNQSGFPGRPGGRGKGSQLPSSTRRSTLPNKYNQQQHATSPPKIGGVQSILESGFGELNSQIMLHIDVAEPSKSDQTIVEGSISKMMI